MDDQERNEAERLNRLWDAALGLDPPVPADGLADLSEAISALHAADDAPEPETAFVARLRREVLAGGEPTPIRTRASAQSLGLVWPAPAVLPRRSVVRLAVAAIAATLLVAALSGGGRWLSGTGPAPLVASAMASTEPAGATATATATGLAIRQDLLLESPRIGQSGAGATEVALVTKRSNRPSPRVLAVGRVVIVGR
jgi:hypothetical protein